MSPMLSCLLLVLVTVVHSGIVDPQGQLSGTGDLWKRSANPWCPYPPCKRSANPWCPYPPCFRAEAELSSARNTKDGGAPTPYSVERKRREVRQPLQQSSDVKRRKSEACDSSCCGYIPNSGCCSFCDDA